MRIARASSLAIASLACGCVGPSTLGPPPIGTTAGGTDASAGSVDAGPLQPPPDPCAAAADGGSSTGDGSVDDSSGGAFKFDVGSPGGPIGFSLSCDDVADVPSNLGCLFWAVDLPNDERGTEMSPPASTQAFAVAVANVSALSDATVSVYTGDGSSSIADATVAPGETHVFDLGDASISAAGSTTNGTAFRVESDVPIAAYQFNPSTNVVEVYSNDASLLLPEQALGKDYTAATADGILLGMSANDPMPVNAGAFVAVVATADDTSVEVSASSDLVGDLPSPVVLQRGEVATVLSNALKDDAGNLSGTTVHADKPVAVFAGNVATAIPASYEVCCADHLEHQLLPVTAWGTRYAVAPLPAPDDGDDARTVVRVVAGDKGADLIFCPDRPDGAPSSLAPGETAEFSTDAAFTVRSDDDDESFSLIQFALSNTEVSGEGLGDPAMTIVVPAGQFERRSVFLVPAGYAANYATLVVRGDGEVRLDGDLLDPDRFTEIGVLAGETHRYIHVELPAGTHALEADAPAGVTVSGVDTAVGYGFAGGTGVRALSLPPAAG